MGLFSFPGGVYIADQGSGDAVSCPDAVVTQIRHPDHQRGCQDIQTSWCLWVEKQS